MINFSLPFRGTWIVFWGGDTKELNHHHENRAQKYAFDFVKVDNQNKTYAKSSRKNINYYCYEQEIISPANGEIVQVIDGVDDNEPGYLNGYWVAGNTVIIKHSKNLYSFLAHFKQNSICVKVGDKVKTGQLLGLCGNSGNSSEPHLHFHLQDQANTLFASGIKCSFKNVKLIKENKLLKNYSPVKDNLVCSA